MHLQRLYRFILRKHTYLQVLCRNVAAHENYRISPFVISNRQSTDYSLLSNGNYLSYCIHNKTEHIDRYINK